MSWRRVLIEAMAVAAVAAAVGLLVNAGRSSGLPLIADEPYQTLVPCPEPGGPVRSVSADEAELAAEGTFVIDARPAVEFSRRHLPGAVSVPYDWLDPLPESRLLELARSIAASGAVRVVVYGDGGRPDSGEHLGREISGRGIKNVFFVEGGAPAVLGSPSP